MDIVNPATSPWQSHLDETSNKTYYFNTDTQETTWKRPSELPNGPRRVAKLEKHSPRHSRLANMKKKSSIDNNKNQHRPAASIELISGQQISEKYKRTQSGNMSHIVTEMKVSTTSINRPLVDLPGPGGSGRELVTKEDDPPLKLDSTNTSTTTSTTSFATPKGEHKKDTIKRTRNDNIVRTGSRLLSHVEEQERVKLHVLESLHAVGFSARSFRHRARDIVNVTNIFLLVISMTSIMLVSYTYSRSTIDNTLSFVGNQEILRVNNYLEDTIDRTRLTAKSISYLNLTSSNNDVVDRDMNDMDAMLLYLSSVSRDNRIVDVRRSITTNIKQGEIGKGEIGIFNSNSITQSDDATNTYYTTWSKTGQDPTAKYIVKTINSNTGKTIATTTATTTSSNELLSTESIRGIKYEPCISAYLSLSSNHCRFLPSTTSLNTEGRMCCSFTFNSITTNVAYLLNNNVLKSSPLLNSELQKRNNYTETYPVSNVRIFLHNPSLHIVSSSVNNSELSDKFKSGYASGNSKRPAVSSTTGDTTIPIQNWCHSNATDKLIVESWRRLTALVETHNTDLNGRCSSGIRRELLDMPYDGAINYLNSIGDSSRFKGHLKLTLANNMVKHNATVTPEGGVELKLTFGADTKIECMRVFLLPQLNHYLENGNGIVVIISEIAVTSQHQFGTLVLIPLVAATLLLMSFGFTHLTLSLLGHNLNESEALTKTASTINMINNKQGVHKRGSSSSHGSGDMTGISVRRRSSSNGTKKRTRRRSSYTARFTDNIVQFSDTNTFCVQTKEICATVRSAFMKLVTRWWLLLVLFSIPIAILNSFFVGRGWSYSMDCTRAESWTLFRGLARFLSSSFRVPVAWMAWREVDNDHNGEKRMTSRIFWISLIVVTIIASTGDLLSSYLLVDETKNDHVTYEGNNKIYYAIIETFVVMCWFAILPFICKRSHSRRKDVRVIDSDEEDFADIKMEGDISTSEIEEKDQVETLEDGSKWTQRIIVRKGWDKWAIAGVIISLTVGLHVGVTHLLQATTDQDVVFRAHRNDTPYLTPPEVSRVFEVVWFLPLVLCVTASMLIQPDAHSHTAFALMGGVFAFLVPYILGRSFLFLLVWFGGQISTFFGKILGFGIYICYMALSTILLETFRQMSLVALPEENVEDAMAHCFVFQLFSCCFLNFMFIELAPLSGTFFAVLFIRGILAVVRGSGAFSSFMYYLQERAGIMPDILKRPVLTLYMDLRWAHQTLVAEIIAMSAVLVAILSEYVVTSCDTTTGQIKTNMEPTDVYPVLTSDFSCAQTVSLIVSDFIVLAVMVIALVFSTSIWHHKFHAMKNIMRVTLHTTRTIAMMKTAIKEQPDNDVVLKKKNADGTVKVSKWATLKAKTKAANAVGAINYQARKRRSSFKKAMGLRKRSSLALRLTNLHKREEHIKKVLRLKSWNSMTHVVDSVAEGGDMRVTDFRS